MQQIGDDVLSQFQIEPESEFLEKQPWLLSDLLVDNSITDDTKFDRIELPFVNPTSIIDFTVN